MDTKDHLNSYDVDNVLDFKAIVERYQKPLFKYLYGMGFSSFEVEEVSQAVFLKIYSHRMDFDPSKSSLLTWIFTIARNQSLNIKRKKKIVQFLGFSNEKIISTQINDQLFEGLSNIQTRVGVLNAVQKLKEPYQSTLVMFFYNEFTINEIAAIQGCNEGTVKSRLSRAKQQMANILPKEII